MDNEFQKRLEEQMKLMGMFYPFTFKMKYFSVGENGHPIEHNGTTPPRIKEPTLGDLLKEKEALLQQAIKEERYEDCEVLKNEMIDLRENFDKIKQEKRQEEEKIAKIKNDIQKAISEERYLDAANLKRELEK